MDTSTADQIITQGFELFKNISIPWVSAVGGLGVMVIWVFYQILGPIKAISEYFAEKKKIMLESWAETQAATLRQREDQTRREKGNYEARLAIWDEGWKSRLRETIKNINAGTFDNVFLLVPTNDLIKRDAVNKILFDSSKTPEGRAVEIVDLLKKV